MKTYTKKCSIRKAGGGSGKGTLRVSLDIPAEVWRDMEITEDKKEVILTYDTKEKELKIVKSCEDIFL